MSRQADKKSTRKATKRPRWLYDAKNNIDVINQKLADQQRICGLAWHGQTKERNLMWTQQK
jgi:hypothetical protein